MNCGFSLSTGGALNPHQPDLLLGAMEKILENVGENRPDEGRSFVPSGTKLKRMVFAVRTGKDRNNMLKHRQGL
ncbi:hypothetical protein HGA64_01915 [Candidatus Falkowbacteria bacterium]|nr:hypothetical protein [Candidatus Falkowbacteria bacterium]